MDGFLNINKEPGMTSFDVIRYLQKTLSTPTKIGHLGTLDPMARGVLPVALGKATKLIPYLENEDKAYITEMVLGGFSDTQDAWGNITYTGKTWFKEDELIAILQKYTGFIEQIPPMYSAVHYKGKRLYELAREGIVVERKSRQVLIKELKLLDIYKKGDLPVIKLYVECSRGTYIRTLCHDIGTDLGTGAYMADLVRIKSGVFKLESACYLQDITDVEKLRDLLLPLDYPLPAMDAYYLLADKDIKVVQNGNPINCRDFRPKTDRVKLYKDDTLLAIAKLQRRGKEYFLQPEKVI
ncbi:tRNA pseudouridine synthase B [Thermosyntropha lipolytica DSM 11003]|uniref:tRNA pseudouridine synthase B n=1 Tax=Thermosyntropha lipolytica DSM 11003 TaxID=1123382 RepID=A0A1M5KV80_9FIRM|nr:tRNA pseudouridine(55) synthase TruB [Thermosyntropha lipolytica]SHG56714.1 tRNA pseudouridine synthase B [Thermosyntropha lipolytica DSM 11003]